MLRADGVAGGLGAPAGLEWTQAGGVTPAMLDVVFRARRFAHRHIAPVALDVDRRAEVETGYVCWDVVRAGGLDGWLSAALPRAWGGDALGIAPLAAAFEEMCAADAGIANLFGAHGLGMLPILLELDMDLGERVLAEVARAAAAGTPVLCAFAITEPGGGSDVEEREGLATGDVRSYARRVPGGYRITGRKVFISNGNVAEYVSVFAALDRSAPAASWTAFLVRRGTPGFRVARVEHKMGQRACPAAELEFDDVFVPESDRIGAEGGGAELSRRVLAVSRGPVGAIATGIARDAFACALAATRGRRTEAWEDDLLAEMVARIRAARAAYLEAAFHCDGVLLPGGLAQRAASWIARAPAVGARAVAALAEATSPSDAAWAHQAVLGATAKIVGSDTAMFVATAALDLVPPSAGALHARAAKAFRDAKLTQIYEGTNQINRRAIAQESFRRR